MMKNISSLSLLMLSSLLIITPTTAQANLTGVTGMDTKLEVSSNKSGTKKRPKSIKMNFYARLKGPAIDETQKYVNKNENPPIPPIVNRVEILIPKGVIISPGKTPKSSFTKALPTCKVKDWRIFNDPQCLHKARLNPSSGQGGHGLDGQAGKARVSTTTVFVPNGSKTLLMAVETGNPMIVQDVIVGKISKASGKYSHKIVFDYPSSITNQAGVPISWWGFNMKINRLGYFYSTSCPKNKKWNYGIKMSYGAESTKVEKSIPCKS